jgi:hypothetical protein
VPDQRATVDYDLHGLVRVRLLEAGPADAAVVDRQLGPLRTEVGGQPDIVIRFVDRLEVHGRERLLGAGDAAFTDDAFIILRAKYRSRTRVSLRLDRLAAQPEFVCERGLPAVPYLIPVLNLTALAAEALPLHAAAFEHDGRGVVVTGWSKGGKTESLLAFTAHGARYVGDEWVYLPPGGQRVLGIPEPVRLWDWHLAQLPDARRRAGRRAMVKVSAWQAVARAASGGRRILPPGSLPARSADRILPLLEAQRHLDLAPARLFGRTDRPAEGPFDGLCFVASVAAPDIRVAPVDPLEVAERMVHSLQYERLDFMALYERFRFAFPEARVPLVEEAEERQRRLLRERFADKPAILVEHPYPVSLEALYAAMAAHLR